jgi:hypothetical protein
MDWKVYTDAARKRDQVDRIGLAWNDDDVQEANAIIKAMQDAEYKERVDKAKEEYEKRRGWRIQIWIAFDDNTIKSVTSL